MSHQGSTPRSEVRRNTHEIPTFGTGPAPPRRGHEPCGSVTKEHRDHVVAWWVEVMGGPAECTAKLGGYPAMLAHHRGIGITPEQRRLFVTLLSQAADEVELPDDPEFRAAIMGYAEWGSRLALHNSDPDAADIATEAPTPRWGWGVAPPYQP